MNTSGGSLSATTVPGRQQTQCRTGTGVEQQPNTSIMESETPKAEQISHIIPDSTSAVCELAHPKQKRDTATRTAPAPESKQKREAISLENLRQLANDDDLTKLEAGVNAAQAILDDLRVPLHDSQLMQQIATLDKLKRYCKDTRTVVAVVGETGAGKTSLINAMLDEQKLLVTSGWRACTAVVCEISYNESDDAEEAYRAEIEFVPREAWEHELGIILQDLVDGRQLSPAKSDSKSEAGIAYAKIQAVYPDLTDNELVKSTAAELAATQRVADVLGTTRRISCRTGSDFSSAVQKYLDSKKSTNIDGKRDVEMSLWPLIKVVRIFCRAEVLSTGLVIVDLPGVADSNPARSAVAENYMIEAKKVWVVAPIKRAADNEVAKELLGRSFRLQMKLDGTCNNLTFICTMTDSIDFSESIDDFDDDGHIRAVHEREDRLQGLIDTISQSMELLESQIQEHGLMSEQLEDEVDVWKSLRRRHRAGHTVYAPSFPSKRKRLTQPRSRRTDRRALEHDSEEDEIAAQEPLASKDISEKFDDLRQRLEERDNECENMQKKLLASKEELVQLKDERNSAAAEAARLCVQRRNEAVKNSIRMGFAAGMREVDEDEARVDELGFDPSVQIQNYEEIAQSLPVFAISAKSFQQLRRPGSRDVPVPGFGTYFDTEVPQLAEHAKRLPGQGRVPARKAWLHELSRLLGSLNIWCTSVGQGAKSLGPAHHTYEMDSLKNAMTKLRHDVDLILASHKKELHRIFHQQIDSKAVTAATRAAGDVGALVERWDVKEEQGGRGIKANTYLATCRRDGSRTNAEKSFDFNQAILEPYLQSVANTWDTAFSQSIPASLKRLEAAVSDKLKQFQTEFADRPDIQKFQESVMHSLSPQLELHCLDIKASTDQFERLMHLRRCDITRCLPLEVKKEIMSVYQVCKKEKGPGCFFRIKSHILQHIDKKKGVIYRRVRKRVSKDVRRAIESNHRDMSHSVQTITVGFQKDFEAFLGSPEVVMASEAARDHIRSLLEVAETRFGDIIRSGMIEIHTTQGPHVATAGSCNVAGREANRA